MKKLNILKTMISFSFVQVIINNSNVLHDFSGSDPPPGLKNAADFGLFHIEYFIIEMVGKLQGGHYPQSRQVFCMLN